MKYGRANRRFLSVVLKIPLLWLAFLISPSVSQVSHLDVAQAFNRQMSIFCYRCSASQNRPTSLFYTVAKKTVMTIWSVAGSGADKTRKNTDEPNLSSSVFGVHMEQLFVHFFPIKDTISKNTISRGEKTEETTLPYRLLVRFKYPSPDKQSLLRVRCTHTSHWSFLGFPNLANCTKA